nr:hypothetical protein [Tanacetum cinerariifolium]
MHTERGDDAKISKRRRQEFQSDIVMDFAMVSGRSRLKVALEDSAIVKKLTKPLDEPKREFWMLRRAALRQHQNESIAIARRNLFDDDASNVDKDNDITLEDEGEVT